jgi:hypothetical protein
VPRSAADHLAVPAELPAPALVDATSAAVPRTAANVRVLARVSDTASSELEVERH